MPSEGVVGPYLVRTRENGSIMVRGPGIVQRSGFYVPPAEKLKRSYLEEIENGGVSLTTKTRISFYGAATRGKRSVTLGKQALGLDEFVRIPKTLEDVRNAIREFWPKESIGECQREDIPLPSATDFLRAQKPYYTAASGRFGGLKKVMQEMEPPYPELYHNVICRKLHERIDKPKLRRTLQQWYFAGRSISPGFLRGCPVGSEEREVYNQIDTLTRKDSLTRTQALEVICEIAGIRKRDVEMSRAVAKRASLLAEKVVTTYLEWASTLGIADLEGEVSDSSGLCFFDSRGQECFADARAGNTAVEVKSYIGRFDKKHVDEAVNKYTPGNSHWASGETVERSRMIFMQPQSSYKDSKPVLESAGIEVMSAEDFRKKLGTVVQELGEHPERLQGLSPKPNLQYLLAFANEISSAPHLIIRDGNTIRRQWTNNLLEAMIARAREIRASGNSHLFVPTPQSSIEQILGGEVVNHGGGHFVKVEKSLEDLNCDVLTKYIRQNQEGLFLDSMRKRFHELKNLPKDKLFFFDIETCGLSYADPIVSIASAEFSRGGRVKLNALFARDYSEEGPMLRYFLDNLHNHRAFFTFNGASFDLPRLNERARQNGIPVDHNVKTLAEVLGEKHIDLYPEIAKRKKLAGRKLTTVEKLVLGFERKGDIPGSKIPEIYKDFVYGIGQSETMAKILTHNLLDAASMVAVLAYLCKQE